MIHNIKKFPEVWEQIFDSLPDLLLITDLDYTVIKINKAMVEFLNGKPEDFIGKKSYEIMHRLDNIPDFCPHSMSKDDLKDPSINYPIEQRYGNFNVFVSPLHDSEGEIFGGVHLIRNFEEFDTACKLAGIVNYSDNAIFSNDLSGNIISWNKAAEMMYGYTFDEVHGEDFKFLLPLKNQIKKVFETYKTVLNGTATNMESVHQRKDGKKLNVWLSIAPISGPNGEVEGTSTIVNDITDKKKAEIELRESEERLKMTLEAVQDGIWDWNVETDEAVFSPSYYTMLGYEPYEFPQNYESFKRLIHPNDVEDVEDEINDIISTKKNYRLEFRMKTKNGDWRWIQSRGKIVETDDNGNATRIVGIHSDVTDKKIAEAEIEKSLISKTNLLREIHHRVKNNMQIVSSLLNLQKEYVEDQEVINVLQESQNRVRTMAMIHANLYKSQDFMNINMKEYIRDSIQNLIYSYLGKAEKIRLITEIEDDITLNIETALPIGLIINEIVSNTMKYAFPNDSTGNIKISLKSQNNGYTLNVMDDGIGLPKNLDINQTETLGMRLILNLVEQLEGNLSINSNKGLEYNIDFKELSYKERINSY